MSDRIKTRSYDNSERSSLRLLNEHEKDSILFSVDVKDVVNKTDLKLPEKGKLILTSLTCISTDDCVVLMERNNLNLCNIIDITHIDFTCAWKIVMVEQYF